MKTRGKKTAGRDGRLRVYCVEKLFLTPAKVFSQNAGLIKRTTIDDHLCDDGLVTPEIESAIITGLSGWRASTPGKQIIRLIFFCPQKIQRIWIAFEESNIERTQEFVLRWSNDSGQSFQEIVRQQWNFSPRGATSEMEDLRVDLSAVAVLELSIIPDISGGNALASLAQLRLAA